MQIAESVSVLNSSEESKQEDTALVSEAIWVLMGFTQENNQAMSPPSKIMADTLRRCSASVKTGKTAWRKSIAGKKAKETDGNPEVNDNGTGPARERAARTK